MLIERREQLEKDIENYQHMLEEANDLKKSWERSESEMKNIVPSKNFTDNSNAFDGTIDVSLNSVDKANVPAKDKGSRVPFENLVSSFDISVQGVKHQFNFEQGINFE